LHEVGSTEGRLSVPILCTSTLGGP